MYIYIYILVRTRAYPCTEQSSAEYSGSEHRVTENSFFEQRSRRARSNCFFERTGGTVAGSDSLFEHTGHTGACQTGHFDRTGGAQAGSISLFERTGGSGAGQSGHLERTSGAEAGSNSPFERTGGTRAGRSRPF